MAHVLVVDDEKSIRLTLGEFLRQAGYSVEAAEDANAATALLMARRFDVVVTDIILPQISGIELLRTIQTKAPEAQIIIMTGEPTVETAVEAVRAGAFDYLSKPITKDIILRAVGSAARLKAVLDEKKRLEIANREYQQNLETLVNERTRELHASAANFRALFEQAAVANAQVDATGQIVQCNGAFLELTGLTQEAAEGIQLRDLTPTADTTPEPDLFQAMRLNGQRFCRLEQRYRRSDGSLRWGDLTLTGVRDPDHNQTYYIATVVDITERKRAEAALRESERQLRALAARLQAAREEERQHIAREVHDQVGQALTAFNIDLAWLRDWLTPPKKTSTPEVALHRLEKMIALLGDTVHTVQRISTELRPGVLDDLGLAAAVQWQASEFEERTGILCLVDAEAPSEPLAPDRSVAMFRIFQEILTNVVRHAQATEVKVSLGTRGPNLVLEVCDDGRGIRDHELQNSSSLGLLGMKERAHLVNGHVEIGPAPGQGTRVGVTMPLGLGNSSEEEPD